jgi:lipopolysaccharide transport system ATP-binding protein
MSEIAISVKDLSKSYLLNHNITRTKGYTSLRDVIMTGAMKMASSVVDRIMGKKVLPSSEVEEFWALKNVSFEVVKGDRIGIIGHNGAGKSTLLKVLSRITEPTSGRIEINGRVASLLEVGTGFHPELTGRENIFLNGAILGMSRREIQYKFDEIVEFAEVEKFLDTPVKRYSSGMYMRLAFSVAAHLEPEILVVDEVLAVGDMEFQKKCLSRMDGLASEGRTIIFVSHNMAAINQLCNKAIILKQGQLQDSGVVSEIVNLYMGAGGHLEPQKVFPKIYSSKVQYTSAAIKNRNNKIIQSVSDEESFLVELEIETQMPLRGVYFGLIIRNSLGIEVLFADSRDTNSLDDIKVRAGKILFTLEFPPILKPDVYSVSIGIASSLSYESFHNIETALRFEVVNTSNMQRGGLERPGLINLHLPWILKLNS